MKLNPQRSVGSDERPDSLSMLFLDALEGLVYESHEEHVDYEEAKSHQSSGQQSGGRSTTTLLLVCIASAAVGYALGKRSRSGGDTDIDIQGATDEAADRIREGGEELAGRAEATAGQASERIDETSDELGDEVEKRKSQAGDESEESE